MIARYIFRHLAQQVLGLVTAKLQPLNGSIKKQSASSSFTCLPIQTESTKIRSGWIFGQKALPGSLPANSKTPSTAYVEQSGRILVIYNSETRIYNVNQEIDISYDVSDFQAFDPTRKTTRPYRIKNYILLREQLTYTNTLMQKI